MGSSSIRFSLRASPLPVLGWGRGAGSLSVVLGLRGGRSAALLSSRRRGSSLPTAVVGERGATTANRGEKGRANGRQQAPPPHREPQAATREPRGQAGGAREGGLGHADGLQEWVPQYESSLSQDLYLGHFKGRIEIKPSRETAQVHRISVGPGVTSPKSRPSGCRADHAG